MISIVHVQWQRSMSTLLFSFGMRCSSSGQPKGSGNGSSMPYSPTTPTTTTTSVPPPPPFRSLRSHSCLPSPPTPLPPCPRAAACGFTRGAGRLLWIGFRAGTTAVTLYLYRWHGVGPAPPRPGTTLHPGGNPARRARDPPRASVSAIRDWPASMGLRPRIAKLSRQFQAGSASVARGQS